MSNRLLAHELKSHLHSTIIGREIIVLEQTGSTNDAILQVATSDSREGLVLFAEHQTAGRGQRGNRWESAAGKGLWFSILLRPQIQIDDSARLTTWALVRYRRRDDRLPGSGLSQTVHTRSAVAKGTDLGSLAGSHTRRRQRLTPAATTYVI